MNALLHLLSMGEAQAGLNPLHQMASGMPSAVGKAPTMSKLDKKRRREEILRQLQAARGASSQPQMGGQGDMQALGMALQALTAGGRGGVGIMPQFRRSTR